MGTVRAILARKGSEVFSVAADETVANAARLMNERSIGGLVVTEQGRMVGIFTERDVLRRVVAERRDPAATVVRDVMTMPVLFCRADATIDECRSVMTNRRIRHLPVMLEDEPCGMVTIGDLLAYEVEEQADTIQHLNSYVFGVR